MKTVNLSRQERYRLRHRAMGLCDLCFNPAVTGLVVCSDCRERERQRNAIKNPHYKQIYRETRRCHSCSVPLEYGEGMICTNCCIKGSRINRNWRGKS
jgi:hypothetical protein